MEYGFEGNYLIYNMVYDMHIYITSAYISMTFQPVVGNIHVEERVSQIFDKGPDFYFVIKNGKLVVIICLHLFKSS